MSLRTKLMPTSRPIKVPDETNLCDEIWIRFFMGILDDINAVEANSFSQYHVAGIYNGRINQNTVLIRYPFPISVNFTQNFVLSQSWINNRCNNNRVNLFVQKDFVTFGNVEFTNQSNYANFTSNAITFTASNLLTVVMADNDTNFGNIGISLVGERV